MRADANKAAERESVSGHHCSRVDARLLVWTHGYSCGRPAARVWTPGRLHTKANNVIITASANPNNNKTSKTDANSCRSSSNTCLHIAHFGTLGHFFCKSICVQSNTEAHSRGREVHSSRSEHFIRLLIFSVALARSALHVKPPSTGTNVCDRRTVEQSAAASARCTIYSYRQPHCTRIYLYMASRKPYYKERE